MSCPVFQKCDEMRDIADSLLKERKDLFGDLSKYFWPEMAAYGLRSDKEAPASADWTLKIEGVRGSKTLINPDVKYVIWGYRDKWAILSEEKKIAHIANMLIRIEYPTPDEVQALAASGKEYEMGKLRKPDVHDFRSFIVNPLLGVDWADPSTSIPSLLTDKTVNI